MRKWIWQITLPLCVLGITSLSLWTAVYLSSGVYEFRFNATKEGLNIETKVAK